MDHDSPDSIQRDAEARVGTTLLGKWTLEKMLGIGGMATVYAATHRNGARGAVKLLHFAQTQDEEIRGRFLREGYIANAVAHDGAVRVLDDDMADDGSAFLVMELLEGMALNERAAMTGGTLAVEHAILIADQLLDVLAAAHDAGIVHRDIKPENVFLTTEGRVKILDFGIARIADPLRGSPTATQSGMPMGTPAFMAPEQARGRWDLVGPHSDLWSVGATLFTLLSGEFVHSEDTISELLAASFTKPARSLRDAMPDAPMPLVKVIDRALRLKAEDRWQNARAMQAALRDAYDVIFARSMPAFQPKLVVRSNSQHAGRAAVEATAATPTSHSASPMTTDLGVAPPFVRRRRMFLGGAALLAAAIAALPFAVRSTATAIAAQPLSMAALAMAPAPAEHADERGALPSRPAPAAPALTAAATTEHGAPPPAARVAAAAAPVATVNAVAAASASASPLARTLEPPRATPRAAFVLKSKNLFDSRY